MKFQHYGFTAEPACACPRTDRDLDFIPSRGSGQALNYDIKYRLGRDAEGEGEIDSIALRCHLCQALRTNPHERS